MIPYLNEKPYSGRFSSFLTEVTAKLSIYSRGTETKIYYVNVAKQEVDSVAIIKYGETRSMKFKDGSREFTKLKFRFERDL